MDARRNEPARGIHACLPLARPLFLGPASVERGEGLGRGMGRGIGERGKGRSVTDIICWSAHAATSPIPHLGSRGTAKTLCTRLSVHAFALNLKIG